MTATAVERGAGRRTYLRIGVQLFPVYGDAMRGFSPVAQDVRSQAISAYRYASVDELYFALVNLCMARGGES